MKQDQARSRSSTSASIASIASIVSIVVLAGAACGEHSARQLPDAPLRDAPADTPDSLPVDTLIAAPPTITRQPSDVRVITGSAATFDVVAEGLGPVTYQWYRDGVLVPGAIAATFSLAPTVAGDDGAMLHVRVCTGPQSDGACVDSAQATLSLVPANALTALQIVAGFNTSVVVRSDHTVWAWGGRYRMDGTFDIAVTSAQLAKRPVQIYPGVLVDVARVSAWWDGFWALTGVPGTATSRVLHWGQATFGSDGRGTDGAGGITGTVPSSRINTAPVEVLERVGGVPRPLDRVCSIAGGAGHLLAIRAVDALGAPTDCAPGTNKTVWIVGSLTQIEAESTGIATLLPGLPTDSPPARVFAGQTSSGTPPWFVVLEDGRVYGFGDNSYNGCGFALPAPGSIGGPSGPALLPGGWGTVRDVATSFYYSLFAVDDAGVVRTSGYSSTDELGLGDLASDARVNGPVPVLAETCTATPCTQYLVGVTTIASNDDGTTLALKAGHLLGWGSTTSGLLGPGFAVGETQPFPRALPTTLSGVTALSTAHAHALALGPLGEVYAWGHGGLGALGDGSLASTSTPTLVTTP